MLETYKQIHNNNVNKFKSVGIDMDSLDASVKEPLEELAAIGMAVGVDPLNATTFEIAKRLSDQIDREQDLQLRLHEIKALQMALEKGLSNIRSLKECLEQTQRNQENQQDLFEEKLLEYTRGIKLLQAKTEEYVSRTKNVKVISQSLVLI